MKNLLEAGLLSMVPPARFELATLSLEVSCSIQLSYGGVLGFIMSEKAKSLQRKLRGSLMFLAFLVF